LLIIFNHLVELSDGIDNYAQMEAYSCVSDDCVRIYGDRVSNTKLKVITQNIRSISKNLPGFFVLLTQIQIDFDVIVFTECWLSCAEAPTINGYVHYANRTVPLQNDGVVIYVKDNIHNILFIEPNCQDANCVILKIGNDVAIVAVYRSPSYKDTTNFLSSLSEILGSLDSVNNVILTGDMNIDIKHDTDDRLSPEYLMLLSYHGYIPAHYLLTRIKKCIDHVLIKTKLPCFTLVTDSTLTDHKTVLFFLNNVELKKNPEIKTFVTNNEKVNQEIENVVLDAIYSLDTNVATNLLVSTVKRIVETNTKSVQKSRRRKTLKPWITQGLLRCIRNRDRLQLKTKRYPDDQILLLTYKRYRNFCCKILKKVKQDYEREQLRMASGNSKRLWNTIKTIVDLHRPKTPARELLNIAQDPCGSINLVNQFFVDIGAKLASESQRNLPKSYHVLLYMITFR
jgi:hypothetical protein